MAVDTQVVHEIIIDVDDSEVKKSEKRIGKSAKENEKNFKKSNKNIAKSFKTLAKIGAVAMAGMVALIAKESIEEALELEATEAKFNTAFGNMGNEVDSFLNEIKKISPITRAEARAAASSTQDLLVGFKFAREEATDLTKKTFELGAALSSYGGGTVSVTDATQILTKAMLGERDSLVSLGIKLSAAEVDQRAMELAVADGRKEITRQDQALATYQLALEQSGDAMSAFSEENLTAKERLKLAQVAFKDLGAEIGTSLIGPLSRAATWIKDVGIPNVRDFINEFMDNEALKESWGELINSLAALAVVIFPEIGKSAKKAGEEAAEGLGPLVDILAFFVDTIAWILKQQDKLANLPGIGILFGPQKLQEAFGDLEAVREALDPENRARVQQMMDRDVTNTRPGFIPETTGNNTTSNSVNVGDIIVNPAPGMNEQELADKVNRVLGELVSQR